MREDAAGEPPGSFPGSRHLIACDPGWFFVPAEEAVWIMDSAFRAARHAPVTDSAPSGEALEFVRFCYRRRRIGWPELYDEMCAVAGRGLYRGWGSDELAAVGIGLSLFEMPALAALAARVITEETAGGRSRDVVPARGEPRGGPEGQKEDGVVTPESGPAEGRTALRLAGAV
jgi:hypothetical protein